MVGFDEGSLPERRAAAQSTTDKAKSVARSAGDADSSHAAVLELQRLAGNASVSRILTRQANDDADGGTRSPVLDVVGKGGGQPLEPTLRREMEGRLGADFSDVRIHRDATASVSAQSVNANAYTVGTDVVFRSDRWNPDSTDGKTTLAHELTHVVQQASGPVDGSPTGGGIQVSDPGDPFEQAADTTAKAAMAGGPPATIGGAAGGVQRAGEEDELEDETAQGEFVQRAGEEDELEDETAQGEFVQRAGEEDELEDETAQGEFVQRAGEEDELEDETAQGEFVQRAGEEDELEDETAQGEFVQRAGEEDELEEETAQGEFVQRAGEEDELEEDRQLVTG